MHSPAKVYRLTAGQYLRRPARRSQALAMAIAIATLPLLAYSQTTVERWRLVTSPVPEAHAVQKAIQQQLQHNLGQPVEMYFDNALPPAALQNTDAQPLVVLLSEFNSFATDKQPHSLQHLDNLSPLMVFFEMPWCLFAQAQSPLLAQTDVKAWMAQQRLQRPVRIGISARGGQSMFWLHVLSQATATRGESSPQHNIVAAQYRGAQNQEQVWREDADMVLALCWQYPLLGSQVRLLATAQKNNDPYLPKAPTFADLKLPPLAPSWFAAFMPRNTAPALQAQAIQALEKAATAPSVVQAIEATHQPALRWNYEQSRKYIENYITTWQSVMRLLQWNAADAATAPVATRYAQAH